MATNSREARFKFTKSRIASLPAPISPKRQDIYYDETVPKLAVRVYASGTRSFYVIKRIGHDVAWLKLGVFPDMTVERAREAAERHLGEFSQGMNPAQVRKALREESTFAEVFADFIENKRKRNGAPLAKRTKDEYESGFRLHLSGLGKKKLSQITRESIAQIVNRVGQKAPIQANRIKALLSSVFSYASERSLFSGINPAHGIRGFAETERDRFLQADELPRFFTALGAETNSQMLNYFMLALLTGARRSNVMEMRWQDLNLDEQIWRIPTTKGGKPQNIPLPPEAVAILKAQSSAMPRDSIFVFPGKGKTGHLVEPKSAWQRILDRDELNQLQARLKAAGHQFDWPRTSDKSTESKGRKAEGLKAALLRARTCAAAAEINTTGARLDNLRIHDLRRTLGSWQAKQGASLIVIGKSLGHKSHKSTQIYSRLDLDPVRTSVNSATAAILKAGGVAS